MLTNEELRNLNKLVFNYIPDTIGERELRYIRKKVRKLRSYDIILLHEGIRNLYFKLRVEPEKGCWITDDWSKYRQVKISGKSVLAHRASYTLVRGSIPEGLFVCHFCDRKGCANPYHLFTGTAKENNRDYKLKFHPTPRCEVTKDSEGRVIKVKIIEPF